MSTMNPQPGEFSPNTECICGHPITSHLLIVDECDAIYCECLEDDCDCCDCEVEDTI